MLWQVLQTLRTGTWPPDPWFIFVAPHTASDVTPNPNLIRICRTFADRASLTASSSFPSHTSRGPKRAGRREPVTKQRRGKHRTRWVPRGELANTPLLTTCYLRFVLPKLE